MGKIIPRDGVFTANHEYLFYLTEKGMHNRYPINTLSGEEIKAIRDRIQEELRIILKSGFSDYFLIVWDIINYCRTHDIAVGVGRGSAGGSVVSYCLGITELDPLQFDLIFERFLNDERVAMPDIDVDVCWSKRQEVIEYVVNKYGENKVAQIVTFGTLSVKSLIDDMGRVFGVSKKTLEALKGAVGDDEKPKLSMMIDNTEFMKIIHELDKKDPRIVPAMYRMESIHRHGSIHAGGVVVSELPIVDVAPVYKPPKADRQVVQYEMFDAEAVGLLKMDLLGLRTVTLIDWAEKDVRRLIDPNFYTRGYRLDDQAVFDIINRGETAGIFQLEGTGITRFAQELIIEDFNDIVALLALFRPGTLDSGTAQQYIDRKNGKEPVSYPHPSLEPVLKDTYGVIVYQEQVMKTLQVMGGFTLGQADVARKAMGKKKKELMQAELEKFAVGARAKGYDDKSIKEVADLIETFARYGFNKSHAVAYAYVTYWTALLKARFPSAFYTAWLNITDAQEKKGWIIDHALRGGMNILPPDINKSDSKFTMLDEKTIMFGLSSVKGCGKSIVEKIVGNREAHGNFTGFWDFCKRMTAVPKDKKEALVGSGAFDFDTMAHRGFFYNYSRDISDIAKKKMTEEEFYEQMAPEIHGGRKMSKMEMAELENKYLAFYVTENPLRIAREHILASGGTVNASLEGRSKVTIGGRVGRVHPMATKKGDTMAFVDIDDGYKVYSVTFFPSVYKKYKSMLAPEENYTSDIMVGLNCDVEEYRGSPSLQCRSVFPIDITDNACDIEIRLSTKKHNRMTMAMIAYTLEKAEKGQSEVFLSVSNKGYLTKLKSKKYHVKATDELVQQLEYIVGTGRTTKIVKGGAK